MQCNAMQCNAMQCNYIIALVDCEKGARWIKSWCKVGKVIRHPLKRDSITQIKEIHSHASQRYQFAQFQKNERRHKSKVQKWRVSKIQNWILLQNFVPTSNSDLWQLPSCKFKHQTDKEKAERKIIKICKICFQFTFSFWSDAAGKI